ncbi:MAG: hypothetical protein CBC42_07420 [Betaproteobacteria bacterium TMED82]|nr:MAG: hypothetical protein CBC42_07420 [Betaproteobacteria bacterium TMED82]
MAQLLHLMKKKAAFMMNLKQIFSVLFLFLLLGLLSTTSAHHKRKLVHIVKKGDTLSEIAENYKVRLYQIRRWNNLRHSKIRVGERLLIYKRKKSHNTKRMHRVRKGETLSSISSKYKIKVSSLMNWNKLRNSKILVGQLLRLYPVRVSLNNKKRLESVGDKLGLRGVPSALTLNSSAVIVVDQNTGKIILEKNPNAVLPIASVTKLMTALIVLEQDSELHDLISITKDDASLERYNFSRLKVGMRFTRGDLLRLALMSSENRAAHALARTYPGGKSSFISAMNVKSKLLGMESTKFTDPTGLNSGNVSSPKDLVKLVNEASMFPIIREFSTSTSMRIRMSKKLHLFKNSNSLIRKGYWDLDLSKTGFIRPSGRCLVMVANVEERKLILVLLDAQATKKREQDAENILRWVRNTSNSTGKYSFLQQSAKKFSNTSTYRSIKE